MMFTAPLIITLSELARLHATTTLLTKHLHQQYIEWNPKVLCRIKQGLSNYLYLEICYPVNHGSIRVRIAWYCIVLIGCHWCPMHCDLFKIYCALPNLGITRTWICRLNLAQMHIFQAWGSLTSLNSQTRDPQLNVPPGGLVLRICTSWKIPPPSAGFEPANLGSRGDHVTPRPPRPTRRRL